MQDEFSEVFDSITEPGADASGVEDRGQRTEDRGQRTEDRGQGTEDRGQRSEVRGQTEEERGQSSEARGQGEGERGQQGKGQESEDWGAGEQGPAQPDQGQQGAAQPGQDGSGQPVSGQPEPGQQSQDQTGEQGTGQNQQSGQPQEDLEGLRKKAHGYESMKGRLEKEREARRKLEERLARLEGGQPGQSEPAPGQDQAPGSQQQQSAASAQIPEDIQDDVSDFQKRYADYAHLVSEDSPRGETLRTLLREYGPDMAAVKAENEAIKDHVQAQEQARQQEAVQNYWKRIASEHDDVYSVFTSASVDPEPAQDLDRKLTEWIESKPYIEAQRLMEAKTGPDAEAAAQLLTRFKQETGWSGEQQPQADTQTGDQASPSGPGAQAGEHSPGRAGQPSGPASSNQQNRQPQQTSTPSHNGNQQAQAPSSDPAAAAAVPSRPGPPPQQRPSKDDYDGAWEEAVSSP